MSKLAEKDGKEGQAALVPAPHYLETALAAQRSFMEIYGDFLETMLNGVVFLVPVDEGEGGEAGFWSQTVYSSIELFGLYRTVLLRSPEDLPVADKDKGFVAISSAKLRRRRLKYTLAAFSLRALRSVQVLIEMRALRVGGARHALQVCLRVEAVKLVLKLALKSKMPFSFYIDEDALEEVEPPKSASKPSPMGPSPPTVKHAPAVPGASEAFVGTRSGRKLPALPSPGAPAKIHLSDTTASSMRLALGEVLFHARPLLHLMALMRKGHKSWRAWFLAISLDQLSLMLLAPICAPRPNTRAAALEVAELKRRRNLMLWALIRSPFFEKFLRRPVELLGRIQSKIPLINMIPIVPVFLALQPFHFTTAAS